MTTSSQFVGGGLPVGSFVEAIGLTDPAYRLADGSKVLRADYPKYSACIPGVPTFIKTTRTKSLTGNTSVVAAHAGLWIIPTGTVDTMLTTPDGLTYTSRTVAAGQAVQAVISDGTNVVAIKNAASASPPAYSINGTAWTQSASAVYCKDFAHRTCAAHAPTLGTVGRYAFISSVSGNVCVSDDRGVSWTNQAAPVPTFTSICWTGQKWIATTLDSPSFAVWTSPTALAGSWTIEALPQSVPQSAPIVSDGNGGVVISGLNYALVSKDHGVSWRSIGFSQLVNLSTGGTSLAASIEVSFSDGLWFVSCVGNGSAGASLFCSAGLVSWSRMHMIGAIANNAYFSASGKSGIFYLNSGASAHTLVSDFTRAYLPLASATGNISPFTLDGQIYVKVS